MTTGTNTTPITPVSMALAQQASMHGLDQPQLVDSVAQPITVEECHELTKDEQTQQLRLLRAQALDLRAVLASLSKGEAPRELYEKYIRMAFEDMNKVIELLQRDDEAIQHILDYWEQVRTCPLFDQTEAEMKLDSQIQYLNILDQQCRQIIYWIGYRTIPEQLNELLKNTKPGYTLPFHALFEEEMPDFADRQKILNVLAWSPKHVEGGVVDAERGLVYCYEEKPVKRYLSFL